MVNPLQKIVELGKGLLSGGGSQSVVGVDIGASALKVVQLKRDRGKVILETYGAVALGPYEDKPVGEIGHLSPEIMSQAMQDVFRDARITAKQVVLSIQSSASLVFILNFPNVDESQFATMIPNEARKYIPVPINEVSLDWWAIPKRDIYEEQDETMTGADTNKNRTEVLVAAIRNEVLTQYQELTKNSDLEVGLFEIEVFSNIRSTFRNELTPVLLVDFGASSTRVAVVEYGVVKKFHTINRGSGYLTNSVAKSLQIPFTQAEELKKKVGLGPSPDEKEQKVADIIQVGTNYIFSEVNNVLLEYEKDYHKVVEKVVLTGGGSMLRGFAEMVRSNLNSKVVMADPFAKVSSPEFLHEVLKQSGPEFSVAVGLALKNFTS